MSDDFYDMTLFTIVLHGADALVCLYPHGALKSLYEYEYDYEYTLITGYDHCSTSPSYSLMLTTLVVVLMEVPE